MIRKHSLIFFANIKQLLGWRLLYWKTIKRTKNAIFLRQKPPREGLSKIREKIQGMFPYHRERGPTCASKSDNFDVFWDTLTSPTISSYNICLVTYKLSSRAYQLCAWSSVYTVLMSLSAGMRPCKSFTHHKKKKLNFIMFKKYTQGVGGWGLSVDFQKNHLWLNFYIFHALSTKYLSAQVVFLSITLIEMGVDIRGARGTALLYHHITYVL